MADAALSTPTTAPCVTAAHTHALTDLPLHHRDPFDRILIAQARVERLRIVTRDDRFAAYDVPLLIA